MIILASPESRSQDVAVGSATVEVLETISISSPQALDFGTILQGVPKEIANSDGTSAGVFKISGESGAGVTMYLQLPQYLTRDLGGDRMPVIFKETHASVDTTGADNPSGMDAGKGWQDVDPHNLPVNAVIGSAGTDIYLGGQVIPSANQRPGDYSGEIVLIVDYNGM